MSIAVEVISQTITLGTVFSLGHTRCIQTILLRISPISTRQETQMASAAQLSSQAQFSHQFGKRQATAASQVDRYIKAKETQLSGIDSKTTHPLLKD